MIRIIEPFRNAYWEKKTMKLKSESYPEKIRRIAHDLGRLRNQYDVDQSIEKLHMVANELERKLNKAPLKKS